MLTLLVRRVLVNWNNVLLSVVHKQAINVLCVGLRNQNSSIGSFERCEYRRAEGYSNIHFTHFADIDYAGRSRHYTVNLVLEAWIYRG